jgi:hypothetical protein
MVNIVFQWQRSDLIDRVSHDPMCETHSSTFLCEKPAIGHVSVKAAPQFS